MPDLPEDLLRRTAALARLELREEEVQALTRDFESILGHFHALAALDVEDVEPTLGGTLLEDVRREDEPRDSLPRDAWMGVAPDPREGFLAVPKTIQEPGS